MESKKMTVSMVMLAMVVMATIGPFALVSCRELQGIASVTNRPMVATEIGDHHKNVLMEIMLKGTVTGTGHRCPGRFCLDDIMSCQAPCGCLIIPGICVGNCGDTCDPDA